MLPRLITNLEEVDGWCVSRDVSIELKNDTNEVLQVTFIRKSMMDLKMAVQPGELKRAAKSKMDGAVWAAVTSPDGVVRVLFCVKHWDKVVSVGNDVLEFGGGELNMKNKGGRKWAVQSETRSRTKILEVHNHWYIPATLFSISENGNEKMVSEIGKKSLWNRSFAGSSLFVVRYNGDFACLFSVPSQVSTFTTHLLHRLRK